ncbi:lipopolysaccharide transport periplasmic protein LptA [Pseudoalteromonas sp. T1lg65]|uniref:lipopolysaccharide transport periplasmic protein LptA n=1 Tax=Pseudoalteromonas sp. T1lg65 TaxID=2077101 RepID=UPI003F78E051
MISKLFTTLTLFSLSVWATVASSVEDSQVIIDSDRQQAQLQSDIAIFEKNVTVIHGLRRITADKLEAHRRKELGDNKQLLIAKGSPAIFTEQQADGTMLEAKANEIRYDVATMTLVISGNAEIKQAGQKMNADSITYDIDKQLISADRSDQKDSRVRTILVPVKDDKDQSNKGLKEQGNN